MPAGLASSQASVLELPFRSLTWLPVTIPHFSSHQNTNHVGSGPFLWVHFISVTSLKVLSSKSQCVIIIICIMRRSNWTQDTRIPLQITIYKYPQMAGPLKRKNERKKCLDSELFNLSRSWLFEILITWKCIHRTMFHKNRSDMPPVLMRQYIHWQSRSTTELEHGVGDSYDVQD